MNVCMLRESHARRKTEQARSVKEPNQTEPGAMSPSMVTDLRDPQPGRLVRVARNKWRAQTGARRILLLLLWPTHVQSRAVGI